MDKDVYKSKNVPGEYIVDLGLFCTMQDIFKSIVSPIAEFLSLGEMIYSIALKIRQKENPLVLWDDI